MNRAAVLIAGVLILWTPSPASATPVWDGKVWAAKVGEFLANSTARVSMLRERREEMLGQASTLLDRSREIAMRREKVEQMAFGELAGIGKALPDWSRFKNQCRGDEQRHIVCEILETSERTMIGLLEAAEEEVESLIFRTEERIDDEIRHFARLENSVVQHLWENNIASPYGILERSARQSAQAALAVDGVRFDLDAIIDAIIEEEDVEEGVSSGRAQQLVAYLRLAELEASRDLARNNIVDTRNRAFEQLDRTTGRRADNIRIRVQRPPI